MQIALVGIGKIALDQHVPAIANSPDWELAATISRRGTVDGVASYDDFAAFLTARPDVEVVSLCMPPVPRFDYAEAALMAGRHVMLEKPPGATLSEVHALEALAAKNGLTLYTTWHSRMAQAVAAAKAWLADKTILRAHITWREDVRQLASRSGLGLRARRHGRLRPRHQRPVDPHRNPARPRPPDGGHLEFPSNRQTPIAAQLTFSGNVTADFDWRQEGPQTWDIDIDTDAGHHGPAHGRQCAGNRRHADRGRKHHHGRIPRPLRPHGRAGENQNQRRRPRADDPRRRRPHPGPPHQTDAFDF